MADYSVMVAPNGARRQKADHAALPMTATELARVAQDCQREGASGFHLHVRDSAGKHSLDAGRYQEAIAAVSEAAPGLAIQITTESAGIYAPLDQLACLEALRPAAASVSVREMAQAPEVAARAYALSAEAGTKVQHILYGPDCIAQLAEWYDTGLVPAGMRDAIFVLGRYAPPLLAAPQDLQGFLQVTKAMALRWSVCAFGRQERACLLSAIAAGGDVRIGFENNIETPEGALLTDNAMSVAELVKAASAAGHSLRKI